MFGQFCSHWFRKWHEVFKTTEFGKAKPKQTQNYFIKGRQLKSALLANVKTEAQTFPSDGNYVRMSEARLARTPLPSEDKRNIVIRGHSDTMTLLIFGQLFIFVVTCSKSY